METNKRKINNFDRYYIDTDGNIYDTKYNDRKICQWVDNVGYYQCNLYKDKKRYFKRVHRLVAETFIDNPQNLPEVNHKDGNKLNNNIINLEWATNSDNTQHGYDNNLYRFKTRSYPVNVYDKITGKFITTYPSIRSMCADLGLNRKTVTMILNGVKITNNYDYLFEYVEENQSTIENITMQNCEEVSRVHSEQDGTEWKCEAQ